MKPIFKTMLPLLLLVSSCTTGSSLKERTGVPRGAQVKTTTVSYATDPEISLFDFIDSPMERKQLLPKARFLNSRVEIPAGTPVTFDRLVEPRRPDGGYFVNGHLSSDGKRIPVVIRSSELQLLFGIGRE